MFTRYSITVAEDTEPEPDGIGPWLSADEVLEVIQGIITNDELTRPEVFTQLRDMVRSLNR